MNFPNVTLSPKKRQAYYKTMREGASVFRRLHSQVNLNILDLRAKILEVLDQADPQVSGVKIPVEDVEKLKALRNIEWKIFCANRGLVVSYANKFNIDGTYSSRDDLESEGAMGLIKAIYTYDQPDKKFSTYATVIIKRIMGTVIQKTCRDNLPSCEKKLYRKYDKIKNKMNRACNHEEVMEEAGFTSEERKRLEMIFAKVVICKDDEGNEIFDPHAKESEHFDFDMREKLNKFIGTLPTFKKEVLLNFLSGHYGWQNELAAKFINPKTKKRYSRALIGQTMVRIVDDMRSVLVGGKS